MCVVLTKSADFFLQRAKDYDATTWAAFIAATQFSHCEHGNKIEVVCDEDEWKVWNVVGDSVRHIEVRVCEEADAS